LTGVIRRIMKMKSVGDKLNWQMDLFICFLDIYFDLVLVRPKSLKIKECGTHSS
jgi:hypothetical protein